MTKYCGWLQTFIQHNKSSAVAELGDRLATTDMDQKVGVAVPLLWGRGSWVPIKHNVAWTEAWLHTKWHLDPFSRLATTDMGRWLGLCPSFFGRGELGPHLIQCGLGRGPLPYEVATWYTQPFGHNTPTSQTDRQTDRQTGQTDIQRSDSIGRPFYKRSLKSSHVTLTVSPFGACLSSVATACHGQFT